MVITAVCVSCYLTPLTSARKRVYIHTRTHSLPVCPTLLQQVTPLHVATAMVDADDGMGTAICRTAGMYVCMYAFTLSLIPPPPASSLFCIHN